MADITPQEEYLEYSDGKDQQIAYQSCERSAIATAGDQTDPFSPPISPPEPQFQGCQDDESSIDPPLYVNHPQRRSGASLFPIDAPEDRKRSSSVSLEGEPSAAVQNAVKRRRKHDAPLVSILHTQDPRALYRQTMAENQRFFHLARHPPNPDYFASRNKLLASQQASSTSSTHSAVPKTRAINPVREAPVRITKPTRRRKVGNTPKVATVSSSKTTARKKGSDCDFQSIEDVCPSTTTLGDCDDAFGFIKWTGNDLDLSADPHRHLLHPSEVTAAEILRLECAQWLVVKRQIFLSARNCHRIGKEFKKTDAQKATMIDVNKASRLWKAFNSVGWFEAEHFTID